MPTNRRRSRSIAALIGASLVAAGGFAYATSILDFDRWMQRVEKKMLSVQKHIQRGNADAAAAEAKEIEELYRLMQVFFENRADASKGVQMSKDGRIAAAQMAVHAAAGKLDDAQAAAKLIARDCRPCHREYKPFD